MSAIGPGDWVECVDDRTTQLPFPLRKGSVHLVNRFGDDMKCTFCKSNPCPALHLLGQGTNEFCPRRFRPFRGPEVERELFHAKDRGKIGHFEFYRLACISGVDPDAVIQWPNK